MDGHLTMCMFNRYAMKPYVLPKRTFSHLLLDMEKQLCEYHGNCCSYLFHLLRMEFRNVTKIDKSMSEVWNLQAECV
jgi:hypothetical protein